MAGAKQKGKSCFFYLGSIALVLSILMKFTNLLLIILLFPLLIFSFKKKLSQLLISLLIFLAGMLPYLAFNYWKYHNPIYTFIRAWQVVAEPAKVDINFVLYIFKDTFGVIFLVLAVIGLLLFIKTKILNKKITLSERLLHAAFLFAFFAVFLYFIYIIDKGVAKVPGVEWEVERFMLLFVPFVLVFCSYSLAYALEFFKYSSNAKVFVVLSVAVSGILMLSPQYSRAYTPQIEFEDGLRYVTKDIGMFLRGPNMPVIDCIGDCPPVAYYSDQRIRIFYNLDDFLNADGKSKVSFKNIATNKPLHIVKSFCKEEHCAYFYTS